MTYKDLQDEAEIIWLVYLVQTSEIPYVREENWHTVRRNQKPPKSSKDRKIIGYSTVKDSVKRSSHEVYKRRLFTLKPYDRYYDPNGIYKERCPAEAVDPLTVHPGVEGKKTPSVWAQVDK